MTLEQERLAGILKVYESFEEGGYPEILYKHEGKAFDELKSRYPIESIAGQGQTQDKVMNLLLWITRTIMHKENFNNTIEQHALALLDYAYDEMERGVNCESLSTILVECLLSLGIKARVVFLMPFSPYDCDNHVVAEAFIPEEDKWIMIDPTYNSYFIDDNGRVMSVIELRECFANRGTRQVNDDLFYNDRDIATQELKEIYESYMLKNLFYFMCYGINQYYSERERNFLYIYPKNFDIQRVLTLNHHYKKEQFKDNQRVTDWLIASHKKQGEIYPSSIEILYKKPYTKV